MHLLDIQAKLMYRYMTSIWSAQHWALTAFAEYTQTLPTHQEKAAITLCAYMISDMWVLQNGRAFTSK